MLHLNRIADTYSTSFLKGSTGGPYATTELQKTPVTSPASSAHIAQPTNAAESSAYISNLAATGGAAAYSSRVANGEGSGNAPNGATSVPLTGVVIAGTTPGSAPSTSGTGSSGSADASFKLDSGFQGIWTAAVACVAVVAGALIVL
jgi:hypothetical protein